MSVTRNRAVENCKSILDRLAEGLKTTRQLTEDTLTDVNGDAELDKQTTELKELLTSYDDLQHDVEHMARALIEVTRTGQTHDGNSSDLENVFMTKLSQLRAEEGENEEGNSQDDVVMSQVRETYKCPITQRLMEDPVTNSACSHSYSKAAILQLLQQRGSGRLRCPVCGDRVFQQNLVADKEMERQIRRYKRQL
ncbi:E3 SUMO-protein ligase NSE2-like [Corticium candelabrum]|uniref:E3 SUMO-protein ligase NSE2-like n=1 Tax=Corticium candelabrum TaxID=121492 RepID=UPI002E2744FC|nr:E3 SUMO-protein ligase NSE2-like [Corticium candelabrum]